MYNPLNQLVEQARFVLPFLTNIFTDSLEIDSATLVGNIFTINTALAHGLSNGDKIHLTNIKNTRGVVSLTGDGLIATCETLTPHDLTEGFDLSISITGAVETGFNGKYKILEVLNDTVFTYENKTTGTATGSLEFSSTQFLGYNGRYEIGNVSSNSFEVNVSDLRDAGFDITKGLIKKLARISGTSSVADVLDSITEDNEKSFGYIVLEDTSISSDRYNKSDAMQKPTVGSYFKSERINSFTFYMTIRRENEVSGHEAIDTARNISLLLYKVFSGLSIENPFSGESFCVVPIGDGYTSDNGAYYVHGCRFQWVENSIRDSTVSVELEDGGDVFGNGGGAVSELIKTVALKTFEFKIKTETKEIGKDNNGELDY